MELFWDTFLSTYAKPAFTLNVGLMVIYTLTAKDRNGLRSALGMKQIHGWPMKILLACLGGTIIVSSHGIQTGGIVVLVGIAAFLVYHIVVICKMGWGKAGLSEKVTPEAQLRGFVAGGITFCLSMILVSFVTTLISAS